MLAGVLYERENITGEEFMALLEGKPVEEVFDDNANDEAAEEHDNDSDTASEEISAENDENAEGTETSEKIEEVNEENE